MHYSKFENPTFVLRALNHEVRQQILDYTASNGSASFGQICKHMKLPKSEAAEHVKLLRRAGILNESFQSRDAHYCPNYERLSQIKRIVKELNY